MNGWQAWEVLGRAFAPFILGIASIVMGALGHTVEAAVFVSAMFIILEIRGPVE